MITPEDEKRYNLKPLPEVPFCGPEEAWRLQERYERERCVHRTIYLVLTREEIA